MTNAQDNIDRALAVAALLKAEFASLRQQLDQALADDQAQVDAAVTAARQADMDRVEQLTNVLTEMLPGTAPDVTTPPAGEPAQLPDSGETSDQVILGEQI